MTKRFFAGCAAACALILSSVLTYAADVPYDMSQDIEKNNIVISGTLQDGANEEVTLVIMKLNKELSVLDNGLSANDDIFYIRQVKTDSDGKFNFIIGYTTSDVGQHKARLVTKKGADITDLYVPIVDPDAYRTAAAAVNTAASSASLTDTEFVNVINDNMDALVFDYELNSVVDFNAAMKNFRAHIKRYPLSEDDAKEVDNTKAFRTFVIAQGVESGKVTDLTPYISDMLIDADVVDDYKTRIKSNAEAATYITGKMKKLSLGTAAEINTSVKTALLYGIIRYADGPGDVQTALENYGEVADVTGSINLTACGKMAGNDYNGTTAVYEDYIKYSKTTTSSSNSGGGGAGGISANKPVAIGGLELPATQTAEPETVNIFNDIEGVDWAHEAITALYNKEIIDGTGENHFEPDNPVTREQFVKIIIGAMNLQNEEEEVCGFADVDINLWYAKYVDIAYAKGICRGVGDNTFGVGSRITRQDMAVMIYNALKVKGNAPIAVELPFEDSTEIADYAYEAVGALYGAGAINGVSVTEFAPNANATRAEAAKMIYEVLDMIQ